MNGIIASDLDGTLVFDGRPPDPVVMAEILAAMLTPGLRLVFATSRSPRSLRGWFGPLVERFEAICFNGALVLSGGLEVTRRPMDADVLGGMIERLLSAGEPFCVDYGDHFAATDATALPWMGSAHRQLTVRGGPWNLEGAFKLCIAHANPWALRLSELAAGTAEVYPHLSGDADVVAAGATKADGLQFLLDESSDSGWAQVVALGNDANDFGLLSNAGRSYVVGDGLPGIERLRHVRRLPPQQSIIAATLRLERELAGYDTGSDGVSAVSTMASARGLPSAR